MTDEEAIIAATAAQSVQTNVGAGTPSMPKEAEEWLKLQPLTQISTVLMKDPAFRGAIAEINQKFQKNTVLGYEITWVLLIWTIRAWRLSKAQSWLTRIWVQAWVSILFWWGGLFLVPWFLWGKSYQMLLATVFRSIVHQFWA